MSTPAWLERRLTTPCTVYSRVESGVDEYGNVMYAEVGTQTRCFMQPAGQDEIQGGRGEVGQWQLHFKAADAALLDGFARVEVGGVSFEVVAPPALYPALDGYGHHVEALVQRGSADES